MPIYLLLCDCPNAHNITAYPFEAENPTPQECEAVFETLIFHMEQAMNRGILPRACPYCLAPRETWEFSLALIPGKQTLSEVQAQCREASRLGQQDAQAARRARMN